MSPIPEEIDKPIGEDLHITFQIHKGPDFNNDCRRSSRLAGETPIMPEVIPRELMCAYETYENLIDAHDKFEESFAPRIGNMGCSMYSQIFTLPPPRQDPREICEPKPTVKEDFNVKSPEF